MMQTTDATTDNSSANLGKLIDLRYYLGVAKRRFFYFFIPFLSVASIGAAIVMWLPAVFLAEGKILVESARIPSELVRPTVTTNAVERLEIIKQRMLTRDNISSIVEKYKLFADRRDSLSNTEIIELVRNRAKMEPLVLTKARAQRDSITMAFTVGFEHERPEVAVQVANELMTVILNEDLRNRTSRASETSKFLERESKRLQAELNAVDVQVGELRKAAATTTRPDLEAATQVALERHRVFVDETNAQIANLKAERLSKANRLTWNHPEVQAVHRKIASLERAISEPPALPKPLPEQEKRIDPVLENLQQRQKTLQENLAEASTKLAAAQLGEALERDQFAERLEVIEQPTRPQAPIRPKRLKLLALVLALAVAAGAGLVVLTEALDGTIRGRADLVRLVDGYLIVPIPMVENARDRRLRKFRIAGGIGVCLLLLAGAATAAHFFLPPPDILWQEASARFTRYIVR